VVESAEPTKIPCKSTLQGIFFVFETGVQRRCPLPLSELSLLSDSYALLVSRDERCKPHVLGQDLVEEELHRLVLQLLDVCFRQPVVFLTFQRLKDFEVRVFVFLGFRISENPHDRFFRIEMKSQFFAQAVKKCVPGFLVIESGLKRDEERLDFGVLRVKLSNAKSVFLVHDEILIDRLLRR